MAPTRAGATRTFSTTRFRVYKKPDYGAKNQKLLRTEHTTDNSYTGTYKKNFADGLHRELVFEITVRNQFGHIGKAAVLAAATRRRPC